MSLARVNLGDDASTNMPTESGMRPVPRIEREDDSVRVELGARLVARTAKLLERFPSRLTGGSGELGLQEACVEVLESYGGEAEWHRFRWGQSIYASLALHFGLATVGVALVAYAPWLAAALHALVAISYVSESAFKRPLLRRLLPAVQSQNAVVTFAAKKAVRRRIVTVAHADAAYTGLLFDPRLVKLAAREAQGAFGNMMRKSLAQAVFGLAVLAILELALGAQLIPVGLPRTLTWALLGVCALPSVLAFVFNADVVLRNRVVPAANDNLSGCVATLELAGMLARDLPDDVEWVAVLSGCEEAGTGGAAELVRSRIATERWAKDATLVLALDTFSGGKPRLVQEGELWSREVPEVFLSATRAVCAEDPALPRVTPYAIPSGATDAWPFLVAGYCAVGITCIDPTLGAPRNYHLPSDTAENLDAAEFADTFRFTEALMRRLARS
jgi:hypothetical protein